MIELGDKNKKDKAAKDWVESDESTDELVRKSFEAGDAEQDWDETKIDPNSK